MKNKDPKKVAAGRKGGLATVKKYGKRHMKRLAKWGAHRMHATYRIDPWRQGDYVLVNRETNEPKALLSGKPLR